jgi:hypothetical protein
MTIIQRYEEFDVQVASETIGHLFDDRIIEVEVRGLGEGVGLMSSIARGHLTFASGNTTTVIVKCIARTENSELSKGLNFYSNEVNFYRHLAVETPVEIPRALYADVDPITQDFLLVLEDLGDETAGDQIKGCNEEELNVAFQRAAELHSAFWGRTTNFNWLNYQIDMKTILFRRDAILRPGIEPTIEKFGIEFSGNQIDMVRKIGEQYIDLFIKAMSGEPTIVHGDYRIDNMFLVDKDGRRDVIIFDWQNTMGGNGTHDIAYFSGGGCGPELRGAPEQNALRNYYDVLIDRGVTNYSFEECVLAYRYNLLITMITPIAICGTLDQGNERGVELGRIMLTRALSALESMDCADLLAK